MRPRSARRLAAATCALVLGVAIAGHPAGHGEARTQAGGGERTRPNVIVINTDDLDAASLSSMKNVEELIAGRGITFENSFVNLPLCCPSRATLLTGQYAHNHDVLHNAPPTGGFDRLDSTNTLPVWLQRAGYYTAHVGKYLLGYEQTPGLIPPGWDGWWTSTGCGSCTPRDRLLHIHRYYGYRVNEQGALVDYGDRVGDYQTDVYAQRVVDIIRERAPLEQPFFIAFEPLAPHGGLPQPSPQPPFDCTGAQVALPAARHAGAFDHRPLPQPPSFDEQDVSDKPAAIRSRPPLTQDQIAAMTTRYRCRLESLLAVDDAVWQIVQALRETGELGSTYVIFTSDNGYFFGEHRVPMEKMLLYEESIRVPLVIRGPGIEPGTRSEELVVNADIAPTIAEATGTGPGLTMDGLSLLPIARRPEHQLGREILLQTVGATGIRNRRYAYIEHESGERELYDLSRDPYELDSQHANPAYAAPLASLAQRLAALRSCAGPSCARLPELSLQPNLAGGRACARRRIPVFLAGTGLGAVESLRVRAGDRVATVSVPPFALRVRNPALGGRVAMLQATADLVDGRRWTGSTRVRVCR